MPNRQVILYDKRRAAIDQRQPYWFEVWDVDRHDPGAQVWRAEFRAGRGTLEKRLLKRSLAAVDADLPIFLTKASEEIRYVINPDCQQNITRAQTAPLWKTAQSIIGALPLCTPPALPGPEALALLRAQRKDLALKQGIGNLLNYALLSGISKDDITTNLRMHIAQAGDDYLQLLGTDIHADKVSQTADRLKFLLPQ